MQIWTADVCRGRMRPNDIQGKSKFQDRKGEFERGPQPYREARDTPETVRQALQTLTGPKL